MPARACQSLLFAVVGVALMLSAAPGWSQTKFGYASSKASIAGPAKTVTLDDLAPATSVPVAMRDAKTSFNGVPESEYRALQQKAATPAPSGPRVTPLPLPLPVPATAASGAVGAGQQYYAFDGNQRSTCSRGDVKPDMALAVGDDAKTDYPILQINQSCIGLFTKTGIPRTKNKSDAPTKYPKALSGLFEAGAFDPRAAYDWYWQRYIIVTVGRSSTEGHYWVAISKTNDPAGDYYVYKLPMPTGGKAYPDFPRLGQDQDRIYLAANKHDMDSGKFVYEEWLLLPKKEMYAGGKFDYRYVFNTTADGVQTDTSQPANFPFFIGSPGAAYFVGSKHLKAGGGFKCPDRQHACNGLFVWAVAEPGQNSFPNLIVSAVAVPTIHDYSMPPELDQRERKGRFWGAGDTSISGQVSYIPTIHYKPALFASLTTADWRGAASALLFRIHPELRRVSSDSCKDYMRCVELASATMTDEAWLLYDLKNSTFMATVQPDLEGNTLTVFNLVGPDFYPSVGYILRTAENNFIGSGVLVRAGTEVWGGGEKWGDYTATAGRPGFWSDESVLWFAAEYSGKDGLLSNWSTTIGYGSLQVPR